MYSNRDSIEIPPRLSPSEVAFSSLSPKEEVDFFTPKFPTAQKMFDRLPKNVRQPSTGLMEQRSPRGSACIPIVDAKKCPRKDAYDVTVVDPDEEWSTLPSQKKFKPRFEVTNHALLNLQTFYPV